MLWLQQLWLQYHTINFDYLYDRLWLIDLLIKRVHMDWWTAGLTSSCTCESQQSYIEQAAHSTIHAHYKYTTTINLENSQAIAIKDYVLNNCVL